MPRHLNIIGAALVAIALAVGLGAPVAAGPFEEGLAAFERKDYAKALRLLIPIAMVGDAHAQYQLGVMYSGGYGVKQDYVEAIRWLEQSAEQDYAEAQFKLAGTYGGGWGDVDQDKAKAEHWYRCAAQQGHTMAMTNLGVMYSSGNGDLGHLERDVAPVADDLRRRDWCV